MKNIVVLFFCFWFKCSNAFALPQMYCEVAKDSSAPKIHVFGKDMTINEEQAEEHLWRGQAENRKSRNALIVSLLTFGLFYAFAIFWLSSAFSHTQKAYLYYKQFSKDTEKIKAAEKAYQTSVSLLATNILLIIGLFVLIGVFDPFSLQSPQTIALLALLGFFLADYFFFKTIFKKI